MDHVQEFRRPGGGELSILGSHGAQGCGEERGKKGGENEQTFKEALLFRVGF
jgi:hypothetical protein